MIQQNHPAFMFKFALGFAIAVWVMGTVVVAWLFPYRETAEDRSTADTRRPVKARK